jgi:hypothetical protein
MDSILTQPTIAPVDWPSDHYIQSASFCLNQTESVVSADTIRVADTIKVASWNVFGESVDKEAFNIFEMASQKVFDQIKSNPELESRFRAIIATQPDIDGKSFKDLYKAKVFAKELRSFNLFNVHLPPTSDQLIQSELLDKLRAKYDEEFAKMISKAYPEQIIYAQAIINMWNQFYEDPILSKLFIDWFNDIATSPKVSFDTVLIHYLSNRSFDVIGIQEVNKTMLTKLYELSGQIESYGYRIVSSQKPTSLMTKTCGVLFISNHLV